MPIGLRSRAQQIHARGSGGLTGVLALGKTGPVRADQSLQLCRFHLQPTHGPGRHASLPDPATLQFNQTAVAGGTQYPRRPSSGPSMYCTKRSPSTSSTPVTPAFRLKRSVIDDFARLSPGLVRPAAMSAAASLVYTTVLMGTLDLPGMGARPY
uniref:Uncharacterized protein n=1 Tax=Knufia peltigerae TaxID=1002370 RepID=A0AA39CTJ5_9EURO|nr:hypothetical protein H2204_009733 [Knufia peltigerae]